MNKKTLSPLATAVGAAFIASVSLSPAVSATENPFAAEQLSAGYNLAEKEAEGKCGEGKCGEGKCGAEETDTDEESDTGAEEKAEGEGKCGEGKCGGH
jgi:uncharacterized low-complexity protein